MDLLFPAPEPTLLHLANLSEGFAVHRIYCIGRNYAEHAREMGAEVDRDAPVFFCKPADAATQCAQIPFPCATSDLHHEVELVVALSSGGQNIPADRALERVWGYAVGVDLTRRDLQASAKQRAHPWDTAKAFDDSAPLSLLISAADIGHPKAGAIKLKVNGELRQSGDLSEMIHSVPETISALSRLFKLRAGDLIFMGTPAGVGPVQPGDRIDAVIAGVAHMSLRVG